MRLGILIILSSTALGPLRFAVMDVDIANKNLHRGLRKQTYSNGIYIGANVYSTGRSKLTTEEATGSVQSFNVPMTPCSVTAPTNLVACCCVLFLFVSSFLFFNFALNCQEGSVRSV